MKEFTCYNKIKKNIKYGIDPNITHFHILIIKLADIFSWGLFIRVFHVGSDKLPEVQVDIRPERVGQVTAVTLRNVCVKTIHL